MRMPAVTRWLLVVNLAVYVVDLLLGARGMTLTGVLGLWYVGSRWWQPWQLVTYMFVHAGFMHLFFNMFGLWMFGRVMEQVWGGKRFLLYYMVCGVGAGVVQELCQGLGWIGAGAMTVGASGAVYGVLLAFGMCFPNERIFIIPFPFPIKAKYFVGFYAVIELLSGMSGSDGVAHFAHLGGMLWGLLLILYWRRSPGRASGYAGRRWGGARGGSLWSAVSGWFSRLRGSRYGDAYDRYDRGERGAAGRRARAHMHVSEGGGGGSPTSVRSKEERAEIDRILEKIRRGGYGCLTAEEKARLFNASGRGS